MGNVIMEKKEVIDSARRLGVKFVTLQFVDIFGATKSCEVTVDRLEEVIDSGLYFDGSSIEGFTRIHESDMILFPELSTFAPIISTGNRVARFFCDVKTPDGKPFEGDPRFILKKMIERARDLGFEYLVGPELEFFLFSAESVEKLAPRPQDEAGYFDLGPRDLASDVRREIVTNLEPMGLKVEMTHHEVAPGQHEIDFKYSDALTTAENVLSYKNAVKTTAQAHGLFASFMPKPIFGINGSGMHVNQSLRDIKTGENAFHGPNDKYRLSDIAYHFIGGQLEHARSMCGILNPTVNSYKRLVPGYEAPVYMCWGRMNRSALIRIPECRRGFGENVRAELRNPDPACNPYLAFAVMLAAGLDGIKRKVKPPEPVEEDVFDFDDAKLSSLRIRTLPASLEEACTEMESSKLVRETLGEHSFNKILEAHRKALLEYTTRITPWELETYLNSI